MTLVPKRIQHLDEDGVDLDEEEQRFDRFGNSLTARRLDFTRDSAATIYENPAEDLREVAADHNGVELTVLTTAEELGGLGITGIK